MGVHLSSWAFLRRASGGALCLLALLGSAARAQPCLTECGQYLRDRNGCCPSEPVRPDSEGTLTVRCVLPEARARVGDGEWLALPATLRLVPNVYKVEVEAPGRPPWVSQVLVRPGEDVRLSVTPACPPGEKSAAGGACAPIRCEGGRVLVDKRACCWPGQRWDETSAQCAGAPSSCGPGLVSVFGRCAQPSTLRDEDKDGIPTSNDECFDKAEDRDGFADIDGCPDPDNDQDGLVDKLDKCPLEAEDRDGFQDRDGCPDPDNDQDGVADASDKCPKAKEDLDGVEDRDGCPDQDNDGDGVEDAIDKCPDSREARNGYRDGDGCDDTVPPLFELRGVEPLSARYVLLGVASHRADWRAGQSLELADGATVNVGVLVRAWFGIEAGFYGHVQANGRAETAVEVAAGLSPFRFGFWLGRYGGSAIVPIQPFAHALYGPGESSLRFQLGNRFSFRSEAYWSLTAAYELGGDATQDRLRIGLEIEPDFAARESRFRRGLGLFIDGGVYLSPELATADEQGEGPAGVWGFGRATATYKGLGVGLAVTSKGTPIPLVELAPIRLGKRRDDEWVAPNFEPLLQFSRYPGGFGALVGARLQLLGFLSLTAGWELGPGYVPAALLVTVGGRVETSSASGAH